MKLNIYQKHKKDLFISLFQIIKNCCSTVSIVFDDTEMFIQGMDKSHICLFEVKILKEWFDDYSRCEDDIKSISIDTNTFHTIINTCDDNHNINIEYDSSPDNLIIDLKANENSKGEFNKHFKIPLVDLEYETMNISNIDYDVEFTINSKKICEITSQMLIFGDDLNFICTEEKINLSTNGVLGEMLVNIDIDDLNEFSISEGETIDLTYSLQYIHKMCLTNKLSSEIEFSMSKECPMKIKYDLGMNGSIIFMIAPKMKD